MRSEIYIITVTIFVDLMRALRARLPLGPSEAWPPPIAGVRGLCEARGWIILVLLLRCRFNWQRNATDLIFLSGPSLSLSLRILSTLRMRDTVDARTDTAAVSASVACRAWRHRSSRRTGTSLSMRTSSARWKRIIVLLLLLLLWVNMYSRGWEREGEREIGDSWIISCRQQFYQHFTQPWVEAQTWTPNWWIPPKKLALYSKHQYSIYTAPIWM